MFIIAVAALLAVNAPELEMIEDLEPQQEQEVVVCDEDALYEECLEEIALEELEGAEFEDGIIGDVAIFDQENFEQE